MNSFEVRLYGNGFMIKRIDSLWSSNYIRNKYGYSYKGIEGDNWPISSYDDKFEHIPRVNEFNKFLLNEYGLINTIEEVCEFISLREKLKTNSVPSKFESREFSIYKLWEYVGDMPIV